MNRKMSNKKKRTAIVLSTVAGVIVLFLVVVFFPADIGTNKMPAETEKLIEEIEPSAEERQNVIEFSNKLMEIIKNYANKKNVEINCRLVGSIAKKTSLMDKADIDIFITFPLSYSEEELKEYGLEFGQYCIEVS